MEADLEVTNLTSANEVILGEDKIRKANVNSLLHLTPTQLHVWLALPTEGLRFASKD